MKKFNIIKYLFVIFLFISSLCVNTSCHTTKPEYISPDTTIVLYGGYMRNSYEKVFTQYQFDSICKVDYISNDLKNWHIFSSRDGETQEAFSEYMYIKQIGQNEIIYRLLKTRDGKYKITKRIAVR